MVNLVSSYRPLGRYKEAEELVRRLWSSEESTGTRDASITITMIELAAVRDLGGLRALALQQQCWRYARG